MKRIVLLPRNLYLNIRLFGLKEGLKLPLFFTRNIKIGKLHRNAVKINGKISRFMIEIGDGGSEGIPASRGFFSVSENARLVFNGHAYFAEGCVIRIDGGIAEFGSNFNANKNDTFWISHGLKTGDNVLLGYNDYFRDDDGHSLLCNDTPKAKEIQIGDHVWISSSVSVLKGVRIPNECVVAYNSCLIKSFSETNCLIGGYPAKVIKKEISWQK